MEEVAEKDSIDTLPLQQIPKSLIIQQYLINLAIPLLFIGDIALFISSVITASNRSNLYALPALLNLFISFPIITLILGTVATLSFFATKNIKTNPKLSITLQTILLSILASVWFLLLSLSQPFWVTATALLPLIHILLFASSFLSKFALSLIQIVICIPIIFTIISLLFNINS